MKFNLDSEKFTHDQAQTEAPDAEGLVGVTRRDHSHDKMRQYIKLISTHGGLYMMLDNDFVTMKLNRLMQHRPALANQLLHRMPMLAAMPKQMFKHLSDQLPPPDRKYVINSPLISHLTFPHEGRTFSMLGEPNDNEHIPAFMTFVGQFIDHDLTLNPINLFESQPSPNNEASAFIDLDSMYNRNSILAHRFPNDDGMGDYSGPSYIFEHDDSRKFQIHRLGPNTYDFKRDPSQGSEHTNQAFIFDLRNDENQIISQIHLLLMRIHNKLVDMFNLSLEEAQQETQWNWQSFILNEYLPTVVHPEPLSWVLGEIVKPGYGDLKHKPETDAMGNTIVKIPHEFSIGFRMGHTQLRDKYKLHPDKCEIPLFDNRSADPAVDLRGSKPLTEDHKLRWEFFSDPSRYSNKIDGKVTAVVFDLPQSTIPDMVKEIGNLPQRNLIRSSKVELAAGEDLAELYGLTGSQLVPKEKIETEMERRKLFQLDEFGNYEVSNPFRTPLWYYVIKEAEYINEGGQLGPLGGRIITEVIAGGIYYNSNSYVNAAASWVSRIPSVDGVAADDKGHSRVHFKDLLAFVAEPE